MSDQQTFSQSKLSTYLKCQRKYQYGYERDLEPDQDTTFFEVGNALHETIRETCNEVRNDDSYTDAEIQAKAEDAFETQWRNEVHRDSFRTTSHYEDKRQYARKAIIHFFDQGPGVNHARRSLVTERRVTFERNGITYTGRIDNVLEAPDGLELVDYKKSSVSSPVKQKNYIQLQHDGEYRPNRIKPAIQALLYMDGIKQTEHYDEDDTIEFTFQSLANADIDRKGRNNEYEFDIDPERVGDDIRDNRTTIWTIIEQTVEHIKNKSFEPIPFEEIEDEWCDRCPFQSMCSSYLMKEGFKL